MTYDVLVGMPNLTQSLMNCHAHDFLPILP